MAKISLDVTHELKVVDQASCEFMISQLQQYTDVILVVKDGFETGLITSADQLPRELEFVMMKYNDECQTTEFHYRNRDTDDGELWVFFHPDVHQWLQNDRHGPLKIGWIVRGDASRLGREVRTRPASSVKVIDSDEIVEVRSKPQGRFRSKAADARANEPLIEKLPPDSRPPTKKQTNFNDSDSDEISFAGLTLDVYESLEPEIPIREYVSMRRKTPILTHTP